MALFVRRLLTLIAVMAGTAALSATAGAGTRETALPSLYFEYALNCTFTVTDDGGRRVTSIAPGTYQVFVHTVVVFALVDLSGIDDFTACKGFTQFQLTGPGVSLFTNLQDGDEDRDSFKETFAANSTYTALDLLRPTVARAVITTTGANTTPVVPASPYVPNASSSKPTASVDPVGSAVKQTNQLRGTLLASVDSSGKPKVTLNGKTIGTLKEGRYKTTVTDRSTTAGLVFNLLDKNGVPVRSLTASGVQYTGKKTSTLSLKKGQWNFVAIGGSGKSYFIVVGS